MISYPTIRQAEKIIKDAIPCDDCDCSHLLARLEVQVVGQTILARTLRLNCGKVPLIDLRREGPDEAEDVDEVEEE
jgi:hypothetical protein